jgi:hypothetical protein
VPLRRAWRLGVLTSACNGFQHTGKILEHTVVAEPDHPQALLFEIILSLPILVALSVVASAIQLDDDLG